MATTIAPIEQEISSIPLLRHRSTVNPTLQADKDDFVIKYEANSDHLAENLVGEINTLKTEFNTAIGQINTVAEEITTAEESISPHYDDINAAVANETNINAAVANEANINNVSTNMPKITNVDTNMSDINLVADAITGGTLPTIINDTAISTSSTWSSNKIDEEISTAVGSIDLSSKQDVLVSGTNLKTINGESVLGGGDMDVSSSIGNVVYLNKVAPKVTINNKTFLKSGTIDTDISQYPEYVSKVGLTYTGTNKISSSVLNSFTLPNGSSVATPSNIIVGTKSFTKKGVFTGALDIASSLADSHFITDYATVSISAAGTILSKNFTTTNLGATATAEWSAYKTGANSRYVFGMGTNSGSTLYFVDTLLGTKSSKIISQAVNGSYFNNFNTVNDYTMITFDANASCILSPSLDVVKTNIYNASGFVYIPRLSLYVYSSGTTGSYTYSATTDPAGTWSNSSATSIEITTTGIIDTGTILIAYDNSAQSTVGSEFKSVYTSVDGINWVVSAQTTNLVKGIYVVDMHTQDGLYYFIHSSIKYVSSDGYNWRVRDSDLLYMPSEANVCLIKDSNGYDFFYYIGSSAIGGYKLSTASEYTNFMSTISGFYKIVHKAGVFLKANYTGSSQTTRSVSYSSNFGQTWTSTNVFTSAASSNFCDIEANSNYFYVCDIYAATNNIYYSTTGASWTAVGTGYTNTKKATRVGNYVVFTSSTISTVLYTSGTTISTISIGGATGVDIASVDGLGYIYKVNTQASTSKVLNGSTGAITDYIGTGSSLFPFTLSPEATNNVAWSLIDSSIYYVNYIYKVEDSYIINIHSYTKDSFATKSTHFIGSIINNKNIVSRYLITNFLSNYYTTYSLTTKANKYVFPYIGSGAMSSNYLSVNYYGRKLPVTLDSIYQGNVSSNSFNTKGSGVFVKLANISTCAYLNYSSDILAWREFPKVDISVTNWADNVSISGNNIYILNNGLLYRNTVGNASTVSLVTTPIVGLTYVNSNYDGSILFISNGISYYLSTDGGSTFSSQYTLPTSLMQLAIFGNYFMLFDSTNMFVSVDGVNWDDKGSKYFTLYTHHYDTSSSTYYLNTNLGTLLMLGTGVDSLCKQGNANADYINISNASIIVGNGYAEDSVVGVGSATISMQGSKILYERVN